MSSNFMSIIFTSCNFMPYTIWSVHIMSCIFMSCNLVRHFHVLLFHVRHFQRPPRAHTTFYFDFSRNHASVLYRFRVTASYLSKGADFNLPHLRLAPSLRTTLSNFAKIFGNIKHCLHDFTFSHFSRTLTCDRQTDRRTTTAYTTLA